MKILIINTSERIGGAAIAANRLAKALRRSGQDVTMLVRDKQTTDKNVSAIGPTWLTKFQFLWERFIIWISNRFDKKRLFQVSFANTGTDVTKLKEFQEADIIHLHWVNQGMLSLNDIERIVRSGKPVVWTMHDMWPFTGVCHYNDGCENYITDCGSCHLLGSESNNDISGKLQARKMKIFDNGNIAFVACSKWLRDIAAESALLKDRSVTNIPNTIDMRTYKEKDKKIIREKYNLPIDKRLLLFSSAKTSEKRKGFSYLVEACCILQERYPDLCKELGVIILGKSNEEAMDIPLPSYTMSYIKDDEGLSEIYNAADVYVTPSLQDNLPNTIMEALACSLPCVGFNVGGIPEMIDHKANGYVAEYKSATDLANGIYWVLEEAQYMELKRLALVKAQKSYSEKVVVERYMQVYKKISNK